MPTLVFMPWMTVASPTKVGEEFELLPVTLRPERDPEREPDRHWTHPSEDVRQLLAAYQEPPGEPVASATLVRFLDRELTADLDEAAIDRVFMLSEALAFAGLSQREFFAYSNYLNRDSFQLVTQRFEPGSFGVSVRSRRRDGTNTDLIPHQYHQVRREPHVVRLDSFGVDTVLTTALLAEMDEDRDFEQALRHFNEANTDRSTTSQAQELISAVSALQRLLHVGGGSGTEAKTRAAFLGAMSEVPSGEQRTEKPGLAQRLAATQGGIRSLWIEDLVRSRGSVGHGNRIDAYPAAWSPGEHLLLHAFILPLLAKGRLKTHGWRPLSPEESDDLSVFDHLLAAENLLALEGPEPGNRSSYQWPRRYNEAVNDARRRRVVAELVAQARADGPQDSSEGE